MADASNVTTVTAVTEDLFLLRKGDVTLTVVRNENVVVIMNDTYKTSKGQPFIISVTAYEECFEARVDCLHAIGKLCKASAESRWFTDPLYFSGVLCSNLTYTTEERVKEIIEEAIQNVSDFLGKIAR